MKLGNVRWARILRLRVGRLPIRFQVENFVGFFPGDTRRDGEEENRNQAC